MAKVDMVVGGDLQAAAADVVSAWKAAASGQPVEATDRIVFRDWAALCAVLTPKRYEMLRALRRTPADGIRALARVLGRDVKRVHSDVVALEEIGLVTRKADGLIYTLVDEIASTIRIAA